MKLRFIGSKLEWAWVSKLLRPYIVTVSAPQHNPETGREKVYITLAAPVSEQKKDAKKPK